MKQQGESKQVVTQVSKIVFFDIKLQAFGTVE
jgi:hypothetical protein